MKYGFLDIANTPSVKAAQAENGSAGYFDRLHSDRTFDRFTEAEEQFIAARDSFFIASVSETGWPYVQHRGGPPGFLHVIDDKTLAFADYRGNRQYISLGNVKADDRVALILVDYPNRARMKMFARAEVTSLEDDPELAELLADPAYKARPERAYLLHLEAFDWNCPQHITPRYTQAELEPALAPVRRKIETLQAENAELRARLAKLEGTAS